MSGTADGIWIFGYGSLMWRPGFARLEVRPALLCGYHRSLCVYSIVYRGTPERPGLVLGLDRGGACKGRAFCVAAEDAGRVKAYLNARELVTGVYRPRNTTVRLDDGRRVSAYNFVVRRDHQQYAGNLTPERTVELVLAGRGAEGSSLDYLRNTVRHLNELGIRDGAIRRLLELAETDSARQLKLS